jgi:hypothetical protein
VEERVEQERGGRVRLAQEPGQPAAPKAYIEERLLEGLALEAGEVAVIAQAAVQDALRGGAGEDAGERLGGQGRKSGQSGPGKGAQAGERIKSDC